MTDIDKDDKQLLKRNRLSAEGAFPAERPADCSRHALSRQAREDSFTYAAFNSREHGQVTPAPPPVAGANTDKGDACFKQADFRAEPDIRFVIGEDTVLCKMA